VTGHAALASDVTFRQTLDPTTPPRTLTITGIHAFETATTTIAAPMAISARGGSGVRRCAIANTLCETMMTATGFKPSTAVERPGKAQLTRFQRRRCVARCGTSRLQHRVAFQREPQRLLLGQLCSD
jgi:hypothetical protein